MKKDVTTPNGTGNSVSTMESFIRYLERRAEEDKNNETGGNYELTASQLDKIINANDVDSMWNADDLDSTNGLELVDVEQQVNSFYVRTSSEDKSSPLGHYYVINSQRLDTGEEFVWMNGSPLIMGKLRYLEAADLLGTVSAHCVVRAHKTDSGNTVLKLKKVPPRAVKSDA